MPKACVRIEEKIGQLDNKKRKSSYCSHSNLLFIVGLRRLMRIASLSLKFASSFALAMT